MDGGERLTSSSDFSRRLFGDDRSPSYAEKDEFESLPGQTLYRAINKDYLQTSIDGDVFGWGELGTGLYYATNVTDSISHLDESPHTQGETGGWLYRAKLSPDAKIITPSAVAELASEHDDIEGFEFAGVEIGDEYLDDYTDVKFEYPEDPEFPRYDLGMVAAEHGYEAIDDNWQVLILNPRCLTVDKSSLPGGELEERINKYRKNPKELLARTQTMEIALREEIRRLNQEPYSDETYGSIVAAQQKLDRVSILHSHLIDGEVMSAILEDMYGYGSEGSSILFPVEHEDSPSSKQKAKRSPKQRANHTRSRTPKAR